MARPYTIQCSLPNTHTVYIELDGGRQAGREGLRKGGREQGGLGEIWSYDVREGGSGSGGRVEEGNE